MPKKKPAKPRKPKPRKKSLGCRFDPHDNRDMPFKAGKITLPSAVNNLEYITPIRNQQHEGSCVGFAVTKAVEMAYWKKTLKRSDLSERWAYEFAKQNDEWPGNNYEGSSVRGGLKGVHKAGLCPEALWPYVAGKPGRPKKAAIKEAAKFKIKSYKKIVGMQDIKAAVFRNGVVVASAMVHDGWMRPNKRTAVIPYKPKFKDLGGHAFIIAGYNKKGLIVVNSWGKGWGKKGWALLKNQDAKLHLIDTWTFEI
jgi:C1A family cysteine protease